MCCLLLCSITGPVARAQTGKPLREIMLDARTMSMDELGNTYVVRTDNTLIRYSSTGDSTGFYRSVLNGDIGLVDATNPLRVLLFYPAFAKVIFLDRMLTEKSETDLHRNNILQTNAVGTASDGRLWVYDPFNAKLLKLDENGVIARSGNDLRQELSFVPNPSFLLERDRKVYLCDTAHGVLIFDQFASYLSTLPILKVPQLQAFGDQLVYRINNTLHSYDLKTFGEKVLELPGNTANIVATSIGPTTLAILYKDRLVIYPWPLK